MALNSYLSLSAGGEDAPVLEGEDNTRTSQGRMDVSAWIECVEFDVATEAGQQGVHGGSQSTGHRVWRPARFVLRLGKSTPFLFEASRMNKRVDLTLYLFRQAAPRGAIQQHFQYRIQQGRIVSVRIVQPNVLDPATARLDPYVELQVVPNVSEVESVTGGTVSVDNWSQRGT